MRAHAGDMSTEKDPNLLKYLEVVVGEKSCLIDIDRIITVLLPHKLEFEKAEGGEEWFSYQGFVHPVIDLRTRIKAGEEKPILKENRIVLVQGLGRSAGLVADSVTKVHSFSASQRKPLPSSLKKRENLCFKGVLLDEGEIFMIIDIDKLLAEEEPGDPDNDGEASFGGLMEESP